MIGTLVGLVAMLVNMSDPSSIGPAMAVALLTTLYGSLIGNILGAPVANILLIRNSDEVLVKTIVIEGTTPGPWNRNSSPSSRRTSGTASLSNR